MFIKLEEICSSKSTYKIENYELYEESDNKITSVEITFPENEFKHYSRYCKNLGKVHLDAAQREPRYDSANDILGKGFCDIFTSQEATKEEKFLAYLGLNIKISNNEDLLNTSDIYKVREIFMEAIINSIKGSVITILSKLFLLASEDISYENGNAILEQGFNIILERPEATKEEKKTAKLAIEINKWKKDANPSHVYDSLIKFMEEIKAFREKTDKKTKRAFL